MSSIGISSTNDVTSTAVSELGGSFATSAAAETEGRAAHVLTTDGIIRECIKHGFYRNPICNEKLYLHHRGYDSIAPAAFEPYTDVKVLWLEGNGLSQLPCGSEYIQVCPPKRIDPFATISEEVEPAAEAATTSAPCERHVDPNKEDTQHHKRPSAKTAQAKPPLPSAADVPMEKRDAFSSLYPTVRQLYLHNNLFRRMPDLSRFERLDSVNLSGNFFTAVEPHCPHYDGAACRYRSEVREDGDLPHPNQISQEPNTGESQGAEGLSTAATREEIVVMSSSSEAKQLRAAQLERYRHMADTFSVFCDHSPLPDRDEDGDADGEQGRDATGQPRRVSSQFLTHPPPPAPEHRNPCSSLRNLNVAANRIQHFEDALGLLCYRALAVLDLSHNHIDDGEALLLILERLPRLQSLKLSGNPLVRTLPRYRKRILSRCKRLLHLDDRPVFEEERRLVTAWTLGGEDGEEKERKLIQAERVAAEKKRLDDFRRLISRHQRDNATVPASGPHADYIDAITTVSALSAAADTAVGSRGHSSGRRNRTAHPSRSDPDSSPTSSDSEENGDEGGGVADVQSMQILTSTVYRASEDAMSDEAFASTAIIARPPANKPVRENTQQQQQQQLQPQRVLSSNQQTESPSGTEMPVGHTSSRDIDDESEDDIFIPAAS